MSKNRKSGESIKQWLDRIKSGEIDGGQIEPAVLTVHPEEINQGYQTVGSKNNNNQVGQKSVFGERDYDSNPSLAQRFGNWITDGLRLTSPPTMQDGYNRTLNAEVPTWEGAQGQELKRMGKTALTTGAVASLPLGLYQMYVNPLAMSAAIGSGVVIDQGTKLVLSGINDKLNESGKRFSNNQQNAIRAAVGLFSGNKAFKWGDQATKRGLEVAMHTTSAPNPLPKMKDGWKQRNWKQRKDIVNYILTGKNVDGKSNTLAYMDPDGDVFNYTGFMTNPNSEYGYDAIRTYLYKEPLYPFKKTADNDLGIHAEYVAKKYPHKEISVYESELPLGKGQYRPSSEPITTKVEGVTGNIETMSPKEDFIGEHKWPFNASGHQKQYGVLNGDEFVREQDIWKFNPDEYMERWISHLNVSNAKKHLLRWGLNVVDYHGTPFITRTPWVSKDIVPKESIDQGVINNPLKNTFNVLGKARIKNLGSRLDPSRDYIPSDYDIEIPDYTLSPEEFDIFLK